MSTLPFVLLEFDMTQYVETCRRTDEYIESKRPLQLAAKIAREAIRQRSRQSQSYTGEHFAPLSPKYKKVKEKKGKGGEANLRSSGSLLKRLEISSGTSNDEIYVSPHSTDRLKAEGLTTGRAGKRLGGAALKKAGRAKKFESVQFRRAFGPDGVKDFEKQQSEKASQAKRPRLFMGVSDRDEKQMEIEIGIDLQRVIDGGGK